MSQGLAAVLQQLRLAREEVLDLEPVIDDKNIEGLEDGAQVKEQEDLEAGAVLKGIIEPGEGDASPADGDLVFLHYSILNSQEEVLVSTFSGEGGCGRPQPFVLGKGARMLRGMELAVKDMKKGERAVISIKPSYAFKHPDCKLPLPEGLRRDEPVKVEAVLANFYPARGLRVVGEAGDIYRRNTKPADGWETPRPPFEVTFHITMRVPGTTGRQEQGSVYFSSKDGKPLTATLGSGQLPPAVEAALGSMVRGDEATVACPAHALRGGSALPDPPAEVGQPVQQQQGGSGSGTTGQQAQSAGDWLEFSVQLLDFLQVRDLTGDGQVMKRIVRKGQGEFPVDCPLEDSSVKVHYRVRQAPSSSGSSSTSDSEGWLYDSRQAGASATSSEALPVEFDTGMGAVPEAIDMGVRLMLRGEIARISATWQYSYQGRESEAPPGLDPGAKVEFEIELLDFEAEPNRAEMGPGDKLGRALRSKEQGNTLFKQGKYQLARVKYHKALKWANQVLNPDTEEQAEQALAARLAALTNLAACAQRETEYGEAITWCNKAIELDPEHAKAYFRRAAALAALSEFHAAREDLQLAAELEPSGKEDCEREVQRINAQERRAEEKARRDLRSFLNR